MMLAAVAIGGDPRVGAEGLRKIGGAGEAAGATDLAHGQASSYQKLLGLFTADDVQIGHEGIARDAAEFPCKIVLAQSHKGGDLVK